MRIDIKRKIKLNEVQILAIGFIILIFTGGIILTFPISSRTGEWTNFLDSLFTATTASCVTGLVTVDTGTHWSTFGQVIIMILIEIGGLGFMSFATFLSVLIGRKITLKNRLLVQEAMNTFSIQGLVKMVKYVMVFTFSVQLIGAIILSTQLIPQFGMVKGFYYSIFSSISTFCNAGLDIFGNFKSYTEYYDNSIILITVSALIAIGGIGFTVILDIFNYKKNKKLSLHSKVVLLITSILIVGGTIAILCLEYSNPETIGNMSFKDKVVNSMVSSVSPRTAGINSIPTNEMTSASKLLTVILMFIGGSPGSTAGGIKTSTLAIIVFTVISVIRGREDTEIFRKRFSKELVYKAISLFFIGLTLVIVVTMILSITEKGQDFMTLLYEATSAFGTVGLTLGVTPSLSSIGKCIIILTMYLGRVGPLTVALALVNKSTKKGFKYPEGKVLIG